MSYFLPPSISSTPIPLPTPKPPPEDPPKSPTDGREGPFSKRASSLSRWMKTRLPRTPSQRPERGGTMRDSGYWERFEAESAVEPHLRRRPVYSSTGYRGRRSETGDSDRIMRWNTAKDLSPERQNTPRPHPAPNVPVLQRPDLGSSDPVRQWPWAPQSSIQEQLTVNQSPGGHIQTSWRETCIEGDAMTQMESASSAANRRLSFARRAIEAKREARRQRRGLKESGDYLGVQGINPDTGQLDIITPSDSENSGASADNQINAIREVLSDAKSAYDSTALQGEQEIKEISARRERKISARAHKEKEDAKRLNGGLRWRKHTKQWSSVQEPALSPIAQSFSSSSRTPVSRHGSMTARLMGSGKVHTRLDEIAHLGVPNIGDLDHDASRRTSMSTGTVIHTPNQEKSFWSPWAHEGQINNGKGIGNSEPSAKAEGNKPQSRSVAFDTSPNGNQAPRRPTKPGQPLNSTAPDISELFKKTGEASVKHDDSEFKPSPPHFLGMRALGESLSQGHSLESRPGSSLTEAIAPSILSGKRASLNSLLSKAKNRLIQDQTESPPRIRESDFMTRRPAFIPTITITGSGHRMSRSSRSSLNVNGSRMSQGTRTKFQFSEEFPDDYTRGLMLYQQNHGPSISPRLGLAAKRMPTDVTSRRYLASTKQRTQLVLAAKSPSVQLKVLSPMAQCNTSPMCSSIQSVENTKVPITQKRDQERSQMISENPQEIQAVKEEALEVKKAKVEECVEDPLNMNFLMGGCPGVYPLRLDNEDDKEDIVGVIKSIHKNTNMALTSPKNDISGAWDTIREIVGIAISLSRIYVEIVAPFFDSSSDYWLRNKRGEATLGDMFAMILAVPAGLLITVTLV